MFFFFQSNSEEVSRNFRDSVAKAIRQNVNKQKPTFNNFETHEENIPVQRQRFASIPTTPIVAPEHEIKQFNRNLDSEEEIQNQENKNAHYSFASSVQDSINDHSITRQETRNGLALSGMYSYSDGFFKRTVHYEADEGGYRVVKEEIEPIGDGPRINPLGKADVSSSLAGSYSITADDIAPVKPNVFKQ